MIDSTEAASTQSRGSTQARLARTFGERLAPAASFATTEHFNLQTARVATVSEANGRASLYLAALSSNLIALAFIGQMSLLGTAFYELARSRRIPFIKVGRRTLFARQTLLEWIAEQTVEPRE